jgi:hypothetical protein
MLVSGVVHGKWALASRKKVPESACFDLKYQRAYHSDSSRVVAYYLDDFSKIIKRCSITFDHKIMSAPEMKKLNPRAAYQYYLPYVMGGLLFGLSWPSYPYVRLEFLAWIWMVPMLLALKSVKSFWRFLLNIYLAMFIFSIVGMSWLITSTILGTILLFFVSAFIHTVPFVAFFFVRQTLGWRVTLWSAPVV